MELSQEQIAERRKGLGGSDARTIMMGTDTERFDLWREKRGLYIPAPVLSPWDAALRHHVEPLILDWYSRDAGSPVTRRGQSVVSEEHPILRGILDGVDERVPKVIDAKFLNGFIKDPLEWARDKYTWQMIHYMIVTCIPNAALHVSIGAREPVAIEIEYDPFSAAEYIDRAHEFWGYVESGKEPPGAPEPVAPPMPIEKMRVVDMQGNNAWSVAAGGWLDNQKAAKTFESAVKDLKALVEADVRLASGHGVQVTRDGRGLKVSAL